MRAVIFAGMLIVFICVFFIFYTFVVMVQGGMGCLFSMEITRSCDVVEAGFWFIVGMTIIVVLSLVILGVMYVVFSNVFKVNPQPTYLRQTVAKIASKAITSSTS